MDIKNIVYICPMNEEIKVTTIVGNNPIVEEILDLQIKYHEALEKINRLINAPIFTSVDEVTTNREISLDQEVFIFFEATRDTVCTTKRKVLQNILKDS